MNEDRELFSANKATMFDVWRHGLISSIMMVWLVSCCLNVHLWICYRVDQSQFSRLASLHSRNSFFIVLRVRYMSSRNRPTSSTLPDIAALNDNDAL